MGRVRAVSLDKKSRWSQASLSEKRSAVLAEAKSLAVKASQGRKVLRSGENVYCFLGLLTEAARRQGAGVSWVRRVDSGNTRYILQDGTGNTWAHSYSPGLMHSELGLPKKACEILATYSDHGVSFFTLLTALERWWYEEENGETDWEFGNEDARGVLVALRSVGSVLNARSSQ